MLKLYADGSCAPKNPGPGGFAFRLEGPGGQVLEGWGSEAHSTNNRMELLAAIHGLRAVPPGSEVELLCDSQYVLNGCSQWRKGWQRRGMTKADGSPVLNPELWLLLWQLTDDRRMRYTWVKGHAGEPGNERVDQLAASARREQSSTVTALPAVDSERVATAPCAAGSATPVAAPTDLSASAPVEHAQAANASSASANAGGTPASLTGDSATEQILVCLLAQKLGSQIQPGIKPAYTDTARAIVNLFAKRGYVRA